MSDKLGLSTSGSVSGNVEALSKTIVECKQTTVRKKYCPSYKIAMVSFCKSLDFSDEDKSSMKQLLFPCSSLRRETLPAAMERAGIPLHSLVSYNTVADPNITDKVHSLFQQEVQVNIIIIYSCTFGHGYIKLLISLPV